MNENKERADRLRKLADEIDPPINPVGEKSKPISVGAPKPKKDSLDWARKEAKALDALIKSKETRR